MGFSNRGALVRSVSPLRAELRRSRNSFVRSSSLVEVFRAARCTSRNSHTERVRAANSAITVIPSSRDLGFDFCLCITNESKKAREREKERREKTTGSIDNSRYRVTLDNLFDSLTRSFNLEADTENTGMDATDVLDPDTPSANGEDVSNTGNNNGNNNEDDEAPTVEETYEVTTTKRKTIRTSYKIQEVSDDMYK